MADIAVAHSSSPYISAYPWSSGFGTKYANPSTLPASDGKDVAFHPSGNAIAVSNNWTSPYITVYPWSSGFGTKYANPGTLPASYGNGVAFSPSGNDIAVAHNASPAITAYPWSSGFGTKYANPETVPAGAGIDVSFSPSGNDIAVASSGTPYVTAYPWSSGFGTKYANPGTLASGQVSDVKFSPSGNDIAIISANSPYILVYPWSSGFGTKYANPGTLPTSTGYGVAFSRDGNAILCSNGYGGVYAYPWSSSGFGTKYANPGSLPSSTRKIDFSDSGTDVGISASSSPYVVVYPWSSGFGTKYSNPGTLPASDGNGIAFTPAVSSSTNVTVTPTVLSVVSSIIAPTITALKSVAVTASVLALSLSNPTPAVSATKAVTCQPNTIASVLTINSPSVSAVKNASVSPTVLSGGLSVVPPSISATKTVSVLPTVLSAAISAIQPAVSATRAITVSPSVLSGALSVIQPTISTSGSISVLPSTVSSVLSVNQPSVSTSGNISLTGFGRKCAITIDHTKVGATLTDFPILLTKDTLPSEMFDADGSNPALNGGGDIRFSSDADGNNQLACDIQAFVTDNDPANGSAEIWVKIPSLSSSTDTVIYVWYNKSGESQPAVDDTYGAQSVWDSNFIAVWHFNGSLSSAQKKGNSKSTSLSVTENNTPHSGASKWGVTDGAYDLERSETENLKIASASTASKLTALTIEGWMCPEADIPANDKAYYLFDERSSKNYLFLCYQKSASGNRELNAVAGGQTLYTTTFSNDTWYHVAMTFTANGYRKLYLNGTEVSSVACTTLGTGSTNIGIGTYGGASNADFSQDGELDEVRLSQSARSAEWITTEYNNQNSPATFATEGTPESAGGGGGATWTPKIIIF